MDGKRRLGQRTTTSESKRYFGGKVSRNSSVGSNRRKKLHPRKGVEVKEKLMKNYQTREEETDADKNVAEEALQSGKYTGEHMTDSAGKILQKRRIKKQMIVSAEKKRTKEAAKGVSNVSGRIVNGMEDVIRKIGEATAKFVTDNFVSIICAIVLGILLIVVVAGLSSCTMIMGSFQGSTLTTTYTARDSEILAAEAYYLDLESQLQNRVNQIETEYPDYDEYDYDMDDIGHDAYQLASVLTVLYEDYTENRVTDTMIGIFDEQYELTLAEKEETRTKMETKTKWEKQTRTEEREGTRLAWDPDEKKYVSEVYTYEVEVEYWEEVEYEEEVEYQHSILQIDLINETMDAVVRTMQLTPEQLQRYELLVLFKGNKSYLF